MAGPGDPISHPHSQDDSAVDWDTEIKKLLAKGEDLMAKELYKKGIPTFLNVSAHRLARSCWLIP